MYITYFKVYVRQVSDDRLVKRLSGQGMSGRSVMIDL